MLFNVCQQHAHMSCRRMQIQELLFFCNSAQQQSYCVCPGGLLEIPGLWQWACGVGRGGKSGDWQQLIASTNSSGNDRFLRSDTTSGQPASQPASSLPNLNLSPGALRQFVLISCPPASLPPNPPKPDHSSNPPAPKLSAQARHCSRRRQS